LAIVAIERDEAVKPVADIGERHSCPLDDRGAGRRVENAAGPREMLLHGVGRWHSRRSQRLPLRAIRWCGAAEL